MNSNEQKASGRRLARIPLSPMYERTDKYGQRYLSGRLGSLKLMIFESEHESQGQRVWQAMLVQGPHVTPEQIAIADNVEDGTQ